MQRCQIYISHNLSLKRIEDVCQQIKNKSQEKSLAVTNSGITLGIYSNEILENRSRKQYCNRIPQESKKILYNRYINKKKYTNNGNMTF